MNPLTLWCRRGWHRPALLLALVSLSACQTAPAPVEPPPPPEPPPRDWVGEIRAEAAKVDQGGGAYPLADADVLWFRKRALTLVEQRKFDEAETVLREALSLRQDDPALWQQRAEIALAKRNFTDAEAHAKTAEGLGIDFGELCVRIRLTQAAAREESADPAGANSLRTKAKDCFPPIQQRF
ncbi:hypothetical protein C7S18_04950 [Ahniella affigens]|uniref:Tetratricopeptide repeat protein n=1 Tax=Ahniella affigens TaxID=2021234 RepID=A0A2P1PP16_9GAMM|nr:tetratricopeptide repeat protein [Ahniella affigens]AVP96589.1 hypothetical protein C7S18_04950 [Ahniella affigens]